MIDISLIIKNNFNYANKLYYRCLQDINYDYLVVNPTNWLFNQYSMRYSWEQYLINNKNNININTPYAQYMSFMYNTYRPDFSIRILNYIIRDNSGRYVFHNAIRGAYPEIISILL